MILLHNFAKMSTNLHTVGLQNQQLQHRINKGSVEYVYYMAKAMWTTDDPTYISLFGILLHVTCVIIWNWALSLLERLSMRFWNLSGEICVHAVNRAFVRSGIDGGRKGLSHNWCSNLSQRYSMGLRSRLFAHQTMSLWPSLYVRGLSYTWLEKDLPQIVV